MSGRGGTAVSQELSKWERTQEVRVEVSSDHGRSYRQVLVQDYTFSPQGASGVATLTSLRLFDKDGRRALREF
jgi:hypothetical protein